MVSRIVIVVFLLSCRCLATPDSGELSSLLLRFQNDRDIARKEAIILEISLKYPQAGARLLQIAKSTSDVDTEWLAIRGLGYLKFAPSRKFLIGCLRSPHHYVRANATRALGEIHAVSAGPELIKLLKAEQDDGVIQQTSLALDMLKTIKALPVLKLRADNVQDSQSECWLIHAIAGMGTQNDVPFVAKRLYDTDESVGLCAAIELQQLTGVDMNLAVPINGGMNRSEPISKAKNWWETNAATWR